MKLLGRRDRCSDTEVSPSYSNEETTHDNSQNCSWKCRDCRKQFTCKIGTVFEHARLPLHKALQAAYLLSSSKKGISSNQLARALEISLKAAWFLSHRIREAMREGAFEHLNGAGEPLDLRENPFEDPAQRMAHRLLRNNGFAPAWIEDSRDLHAEMQHLKTHRGQRTAQSRRWSRTFAFHVEIPLMF